MITTVLIVDDDPQMREVLTSILSEAGYFVETADNGKGAINVCNESPIDVALIDIGLPDIQGTKLLSTLKKLQPKMVRIIITGQPSIENAVTSVNEKADGYLLKPFNPPDLLDMIKRIQEEKKIEYLNVLREVEQAQQNTPVTKYKSPEKW